MYIQSSVLSFNSNRPIDEVGALWRESDPGDVFVHAGNLAITISLNVSDLAIWPFNNKMLDQ